LAAGLWGDARRHLEKLVAAERGAGGLSHGTCRAMAALEEGERADPKTAQSLARQWLDAAAEAQPDPARICSGFRHPGEAGPASGHRQAVCPHCPGTGTYRWRRPGLPSADILLGPPAAPVAMDREPQAELAAPAPAPKPVVSPQNPASATPPAVAE